MSRRIPTISDLNIRSEQPIKRFKTSPTALDPSSYRNIFEQFDDVPPSPTLIVGTQANTSKFFAPKASSQQSSSTSSSTARSIMTKTTARSTDELWSTLFRPKARQDLIVHPKKVKELEELLQRSCEIIKTNKRPSKLILISGPSGSGKSTCLRILASSLSINVVEWETKTTSNLTTTAADELRDDRQWAESQKRSFRTFVFQSARYLSSSTGNTANGLMFENDDEEPATRTSPPSMAHRQLVLVEDLPNGFYSDPAAFHSTLRELKRVAHHPIVFVIADNCSLTAASNPHLLFSLAIIDELKIEQISFNAIAPTYMKKGLEALIHQASLLKLKPPSRDCISEIVQTANGDLRLAINTVQFASNTRGKTSSTTSVSKDTCLSLFQGLGRILYKKDAEDVSADGHRNQQPENLIEQCHISPATFVGFLFENYLDFYSSVDDAARLDDHLSFTEYILYDWETRSQLLSIASSIACRAVRLCNSMPASRGFKPMRKPPDNDVKSRAQKNRALLAANKLYYGCSNEEYFTTILPFQARLLKASNSSALNATNRAIVEMGFIDRYARKRHDLNSMVTEKNSAVALLTDTTRSDADDGALNFALHHATTSKVDKFEYDDSVEIDSSED